MRKVRYLLKLNRTIRQLEYLRSHCESMINDNDSDDIWIKDIDALNMGIKAIQMIRDYFIFMIGDALDEETRQRQLHQEEKRKENMDS